MLVFKYSKVNQQKLWISFINRIGMFKLDDK